MNLSSLSRSEQKRAQILQAAITLFCGQGFPNTSMDEVAKQAGVSKQTVYSHFGSKNDLFVASIESKCVAHQVAQDLFVNPKDPQKALMQFGIYFGEMIVSPEALDVFKTCVAQSDSHPELSELFFNAGPQYLLELLESYFSKVEANGEFQFENRRHAALQFCLMLFGEMRLKLELGLPIDDIKDDRNDYIKSSVTMFLRAYRIEK
ncbi:TetR/AcrR family transcriptional regulator [Shewanella sp. Isolate11]|uniref:TetR/AcrR family transcriptional regulator n=1 Tax=Shewanella sp. Isolate11 TaxID=2908530 RepID=UPI001EFCA0E3|nr:TetR/AcrR family transcriptional regulator [Shewanella sp. Isolate11]MCG9697191.1 TetR/AcrR family transcriptional regulator [Shewanella sp. Isolate11]